ncbi:8-oxo-dGTP diphosphatase [Arthrobacter sp. CAN_A6]|uniref:8-oxo-dGTP diphosphatase n=1 Tax=Arthrobacter sp. CAN_A6 TaxID=2787721 RepID=UPI0018C9AB45
MASDGLPEPSGGFFRPVALCFLFDSFPAGAPGAIGPDARPVRRVLLGLKKTGFGTGRIVALGGKLEPGESAAQAAAREVFEEAGLRVEGGDLTFLGTVTWDFPARPDFNMIGSIFTAERYTGTLDASDEVDPEWFPEDALPWDGMWEDAASWVPLVVEGEPFTASITLRDDNEGVETAVVRTSR